MLTFEELRWNFKAIKFYSALNVLPIQIDMETGKIKRQRRSKLNTMKSFLHKGVYFFVILHWLYIFGRLLQSTILEPEKYFRWDHFVIHFACVGGYAVFYYTGYCLFTKNPEECFMIFNQLFVQRENAVQKMAELQNMGQLKWGKQNAGELKETKEGTELQPMLMGVSVEMMKRNIRKKGDSGSGSRFGIRPLLSWPPQYSLDELLARLIFLVMTVSIFVIIFILAVDPSRPQLLYSSLPLEYQNPFSFLALLAVETVCVTLVCAILSFSVLIQLLFFSKCQLEFQLLNRQLRMFMKKYEYQGQNNWNAELKRKMWILRQILDEMRELVVFIELFNGCFPFCILALKILCMSGSILMYFFTIRHHEDFPFLAVFAGYVAVAATLIYNILYEHAFSVPGNMEQLKNEFLLTAQKMISRSQPKSSQSSVADFNSESNSQMILWAEMKREIQRMRTIGIKVGSFYHMERESTPNFVNFVINQVVNVLVTFPR